MSLVPYSKPSQSKPDDRKSGFVLARPSVSLFVFTALGFVILGLATQPVRADDDDETKTDLVDRLGSSVGNSLGGVKKFFGIGKAPPPPASESPSGCPAIDVLDGTGAQRIMAINAAGNAGVKYQYSISDVARECQLSNNQMTLKVGVAGRVLLGPSGVPGRFDVPIRIAIVNQADQKPLVSKLYKVAASIPTGQAGTAYTFVADSLVIPFAAGRTAGDYGIKIGIDTGRGGDQAAPSGRKKKPVTAAQ